MTQSLLDKVAIVTGSSSGIGEAVARLFSNEGAKVVVNSSSSIEAGEKVASELAQTILSLTLSPYTTGEVLLADGGINLR